MSIVDYENTYHSQVHRTLWQVLALNLIVATVKIVVGLLTHSLAMVADGFHSTMDASSNVIGLFGNAIAARPPDDSHPYGHERFETIATLAIGALLLGAAIEILRNVIQRIINGGSPQVTTISFIAMLITLAINIATFIYEKRVGHRLKSELLLADAAHTTTDVFVSLSVIVSLAAVALGIQWFDIVTASGIVVLILIVAYNILRRTADVLADAAATNPQPIQAVAAAVPGVAQVTRVRSRGPQAAVHVDIDVDVNAALTAQRTHAIAAEITQRIKDTIDGVSEVEVHFTPRKSAAPDYMLVSRAVAAALGVDIHEIVPVRTANGIVLDMHVEMDGSLSLNDAHLQATELERRVRAQLPDVIDVVTHIEPAPSGETRTAISPTARTIRSKALAIAYELYPDANWHDLRVIEDSEGYALTLHCHLPGSVSLDKAHATAERVETQLRAELPHLTRVTIHTEPPE